MAFIAFVGAGALEEFVKLLVFLTPLTVSKQSRTAYDMIFLAAVSGASFGTLENLIVAYSGITVAFQRFIWCTATHTSDLLAGVMILVYMKCAVPKRVDKVRAKWYLYPFIYIIPVALHGAFDFFIFYGKILKEPWIGRISILIGVISLAIFFAMFYPIRRTPREQVPHIAAPNVFVVKGVPSYSSSSGVLHM